MSSSSVSKPKLDDAVLALPPRSSLADHTRLQFFVRILSDQTLVFQADSTDTIKSIHEKILSITGIPIIEQRLVYRGKQLQSEQTLSECKIRNDVSLQLVGRMRSTEHPQAWQLLNDVVSLIFYMYKNNPPSPPPETLISMLVEFLVKALTNQDGYLKIFNSSSTPATLVMLYMSSHQPNRDAAHVAIEHILSSSNTTLAKDKCAPVVFEFCRLLNRAAGVDDPLYIICRSSLATMVGCIGIGKGKGLIGIADIFHFVSELATKISHNLRQSQESTPLPGLSRDVSDFFAFLVPVKNEIKGDVGRCGTIRVPTPDELCSLQQCSDEAILLRKVFVELLDSLEQVLVKIEEHVDRATKQDNETLPFGCSEYLALLKELNSIAKLYYGCERMFWAAMKRRKGALCYIIVKYVKKGDDHKWILDCNEVTNFEARRHLAMLMLPEPIDD